ncbi:hypothetical protein Tco_0289437 [Tanacetum coccineum]
MRISSISIGSSDVQPSKSSYLLVLFIGTSQSRQHNKSESIPPALAGSWDRVPNLTILITPINEHEVLASVNIFLCPKSGVHPWISPVDPEFLDSIVQCFINLLQSAITSCGEREHEQVESSPMRCNMSTVTHEQRPSCFAGHSQIRYEYSKQVLEWPGLSSRRMFSTELCLKLTV